MILVTGATGNVGSNIVKQLVAAGHRVRALSRNPSIIRNVETVSGDLRNTDSLKDAFAGVQGIFLFPAANIAPNLGQIAAEQGVRRIVVLSSAANQRLTNVQSPIAAKHAAAEDTVRSADLEWTILRSDSFATNALAWAPSIRTDNVVRAPFSQAHRNPIHEADVAGAVVSALTLNGHAGKTYMLTGPQSLTQADQVASIGRAINRDIRFEEQTREEARAEMVERIPVAAADQLLNYLEQSVNRPAHVLDTVERLTGSPARTFMQWAFDHADEFR